MQLRPYQQRLDDDTVEAFNAGHRGVLAVLPTGGGKTVTFSHRLKEHNGRALAIAHRQELVGQISTALAREGIRHSLIAPKAVIKYCVKLHVDKIGRSFYDPNADTCAAGVDTLIRRNDPAFTRWSRGVSLWVMDEAHHVLRENKWGRAVDLFPNARGLGVTATPIRADGKGLGSHADGHFNTMVQGPSMRGLINSGYLTDYRIVAPKTEDLNRGDIKIGASGEMTQRSMISVCKKSKLVGDVVKHYLKFAEGKRGVTFATDVESAQKISDEFNSRGVPAMMVHGGSSDSERDRATKSLEDGRILQLINVDLFGEGFDLPAIEVVSMARPTSSLSLYMQQFGRALRLIIDPAYSRLWDTFDDIGRRAHISQSAKPKALIIDHVGNTDLLAGGHGLPDAKREWSLDARERRSRGTLDEDVIPTTTCKNPECMAVYERILVKCPYCSTVPKRASRSGPEYVDGDLTELDDETLARMRGEVEEATKTPEVYAQELTNRNVPIKYRHSLIKKYQKKYKLNSTYLAALKNSIEWYAGVQRFKGLSDREIMRKFYYQFGIDVQSARGLEHVDALDLIDRVNRRIAEDHP